jgi:nitroimidazol reductase NimA-like FMN-containing flavoprotein (pyridoxamine 5'-phosphate oxidase superfamily)
MGPKPTIVKLTPEDCLTLLGQTRIGRVAVSIDALPAVRTVRFVLASGNIVFRAATDSRLREAVTNAVVAFQADHCDDAARQGWSVLVRGVGEEVNDADSVAQLRSLPLEPWADSPTGDRFLRIPISMVSGERVFWPLG